MTDEKLAIINEAITDYFGNNTDKEWVSAKEIMPQLIEKGIFVRDKKNGQPIRKVLKELDANNELNKVPAVHAERVQDNTYWYIVKEGSKYVSTFDNNAVTKKQQKEINRKNSDEYYLVSLCDEVLSKVASRQHTFKFLLGDVHSDGKSQTKLALDAFYKDLSLVLEFFRKHIEDDSDLKPTIVEVNKAEKRKVYDQRKKIYLEDKGINLIHIDYDLFETEDKRLVRNTDKDTEILKGILVDYIK